jgi:malonate-semialdehyde dehydrogenase (acetylating) / methylmalonate-semialdehyde dehydrogenase
MIIMPDADMDQAADALVGAGYGAAGERCMAISVAVPVGEGTAEALREAPCAQDRGAEGRPLDRPANDVDYGPVVTAAAKQNILRLVETGVAQGPSWSWTGAISACRAMRTGSSWARICSTM